MSDAADKPKRATYQDILNAPENKVAEIINGALHLSPRPAPPHCQVASNVGFDVGAAFHRGRGGPGGWMILPEPELHIGEDVLVPDWAGWRRERVPAPGFDDRTVSVPPDWICEVLSKSTEKIDRNEKMPIYAAHGVQYAWLVHPGRRTLEVFRLEDEVWITTAVHRNGVARIEPFHAIELDVDSFWADVPMPPVRAGEPAGVYEFERDM
jgi:Uma2 family endonuclease